MVQAASATTFSHVGFLTVLNESNGFLGGYLVTNVWGRPLEFRLSSAVQPNRVQQILYGDTLYPYICSDLIAKTLVEKASLGVQLVITDKEIVLDLRHKIDLPVVWVTGIEETKGVWNDDSMVLPANKNRGVIRCHPSHLEDVGLARENLERLDGSVDLMEPFSRIREAIAEARKMGVTAR